MVKTGAFWSVPRYVSSCMLVNHGTMEMRCYCKILRISYKDHVTNVGVCAKIQQAIGPHEDLLMQNKVVWTNLTFIRSGQTTVKGGRRQGRQRKRWEDIIKALIDLEFAKSQSAVENREEWRKLVVKLSVCPNDPHG